MRKCKNCGELVADNVSFCPECGSMEFEVNEEDNIQSFIDDFSIEVNIDFIRIENIYLENDFLNVQFLLECDKQIINKFIGCSIKVNEKIYDLPGEDIISNDKEYKLTINVSHIKNFLMNNEFQIMLALWDSNLFKHRLCDSGWVKYHALDEKSFQNDFIMENHNDFFQNQSVSNKLKLILLDENENELKDWTLGKLPSYTLGRISSKGSVDIDFTDFENGQYVSRRHGKIYKKNNKWYYSDLGSKHGSELISNAKRENLVPMEEYELNNGNILILAKKIKLEIQLI